VLVGADTADDAAVYALDEERAIVATVDVFTPIVDDPYDWGRVAAINAVSDVYAMGGRPLLGLNVVAWPSEGLPTSMLTQVLQGGVDAAETEGFPVLGGHSIVDPEPKYGMVVIGTVGTGNVVSNAGARAGDTLLLSKPIGLGIATTAVKRGLAPRGLEARAVEIMATSNAATAEAMRAAGVRAATDITGFGLLGHLGEMLRASGVAAHLDAAGVGLLPGTLALAEQGCVPGGSERNLEDLGSSVDWGGLPAHEQLVLADAQTSGGLLMASSDPDLLAEELTSRGVTAARIGRVREGVPGRIEVRGRLAE
jgi:selenide,water dikinase